MKKTCECENNSFSDLVKFNEGRKFELIFDKNGSCRRAPVELIFDALICTKCNYMVICSRDRANLMKATSLVSPISQTVPSYNELRSVSLAYTLEDPEKKCSYDIFDLIKYNYSEATSNEK